MGFLSLFSFPSSQESDNPDLRDRGYIYWRLLFADPNAAIIDAVNRAGEGGGLILNFTPPEGLKLLKAAEEQGLLGATFFARAAKAKGMNVAGMITNDIIGKMRVSALLESMPGVGKVRAAGFHAGRCADRVEQQLAVLTALPGVGLVLGYALLGAAWLVLKTDGALQARARRQIPALAGALLVTVYGVNSGVGTNISTKAFIMIMIGGAGVTSGAIVGGILLGFAEAIGYDLLPGSLTYLLIFMGMIVFLVFKPNGLFGKPWG